MRLICPNCGAQYAVGDDVIPPDGRDVQCSSCAHTWFETPGASANDGVTPVRPKRPAPSPAAQADAGKIAPAPQATEARRKVDPSVADILREEAKREAQKRQAEQAAPVESQSDLGLSGPAPAPRPRARSIDPSQATPAETAAAATGAVAAPAASGTPRKEQLPDIEEINSSLRSDAERTENGELAGQADADRQRRGFRRSFFLMLLIFAALVAIYVQADAIKAAVPALTGVMDSYVGFIDGFRIWLDTTVKGFLPSDSGATPTTETDG